VLASLNLSEITSSEAPLALIIERYSSLPTEVMGLIGMIAIINGGLVQVVMVSRLIYGMAEINRAPAWFAKVSTKTKTPINATVVTGLAIWALTIFVDLRTLAEGTGTVILSVFALVNLALVQLRRRETSKHPGFRVPLAIPITGFLLCCFLLLNSWILS
jgi:APA family basic amino acid/polyamine antiporter